MKKELKASKRLDVRFSEIDMMKVVWHGAYPLYFEDVRELFGEKYGLTYMGYVDNGYYAPIVDLSVKYRQPILYGSKPRVDITYRPTESAKVVFDYEIRDEETDALYCTGRSVQVFMDLDYQLVWDNPPFYKEWKRKWGQL